ncbi:MAG TPA: DUF1684 domain-containing protein [Holophagaceae bacterium]|nr:DUF1684 domain-containing protein [Holophagaceae bacterium]
MRLALGFTAMTLLAQTPQPTPKAAFEAWHKGRIERLKSEEGWLSLVGLHWLTEGENVIGTKAGATVPFPPGLGPEVAGTLVLEGGQVRLKAAAGSPLMVNGAPAADMALKADTDGKPDVLQLAGRSFFVIKRGPGGAKVGVRVKDPKSPVRTGFKGIDMYPFDPAFRVVATFEAYPEPRTVNIPTVIGVADPMKAWGRVHFTLKGKTFSLEPVDEGDGRLFFIFRDLTSGKTTYPAGRFVYAEAPKDGKVILDFNQSYNPPCAFTRFATCPLPPPQNVMKIAIRAGEKNYGEH